MQSKGVIDDVGRHLAQKWKKEHPGDEINNPWSLSNVAKIKCEFDTDSEATKKKYPELFYYYDGLLDTKISQSVHPAGMVISPITLDDNFGTFNKDGETCLLLDMDNIHEYTGLAKYDFLILKTVQVIRDTCRYLDKPYPKMHEINWDDKAVWDDMIRSPVGIFQMESDFSFDCLKKFKPKNIFEMSLVTACIRPSGTSYRQDLLEHKVHKNPSGIIDELLKDNLGYLIYQEDTIKFLQQICGLSGSDADNIRRAIGRKQKDRLEKAMPNILEGYCAKSGQPRQIAEQEAKEFLQVIEDSASYQFGYNHSISYCLLGYLCAYYRHYFPLEFLTSFLNNAANEDDIENGTAYAEKVGIKVTMPKWGISKSEYSFNKEKNIIAKGMSSVKYMSNKVTSELFNLASSRKFTRFMDVLMAIDKTSMNTRQMDILIKIDFFSDFGNQRELLRMTELYYETFKKGSAKQISKQKVAGTVIEDIVKKHSTGTTKAGADAKNYTIQDMEAILYETEDMIRALGMEDLSVVLKMQNFKDAMGYAGYVSGKEEDRNKLYLIGIYPLVRKKDGVQFGYSFITRSIGSGIESRFTVLNKTFNSEPVKEGNIIKCLSWNKEGRYFKMNGYKKIY